VQVFLDGMVDLSIGQGTQRIRDFILEEEDAVD